VTLRMKALLLVALNLSLVALAAFAFAAAHARRPFDSWLLSAGRERLEGLARLLLLELPRTDAVERDALLERHSAEQGAVLLLVGNDGSRIAGPPLEIPEGVLARVRAPGRERGNAAPLPPALPEPGSGRRGLPPLPGAPPFLVKTDGELRYWVGLRMPVPRPGSDEVVRGTLLVASRRFWTHPLFLDLRPWLAVGALAVAISLACWLPFFGRLAAALGQMTRATATIADGRFDVALATGRRDEFGRLARSIASMAARLETLVRGQKRFLADVAHELRSPLGRMQMALGVLEARAGAAGRPHLDDLREEVELMSRLSDELLAYARAELRPESLRLVRTNVAETALRAVRLEARDGADVRVEIAPELHVRADPDYLFRSLANVLRNSVRHAGAAGPIVVRARPEGDRVVITVADSGPGLPASSLTHVFEPFYRSEDSRDRRSGGTGLGLAIVRSCLEACGGSVECRNGDPAGLIVTMTLASA